MNVTRIFVPALLLCPLFFAGCGKTQESPALQKETPTLARPSAALGLYVSHYLGRGILPLTTSALRGLDSGTKLVAGFDPLQSQDTFALLQEFGNILQVNIPDILNRSTDRPATLNAYVESLQNITERCKRMRQELQRREDDLRVQERDVSTQVSTLQRRIDQAFRGQDFSTAGALRQDLSTAKIKQSQVSGEGKEARDLGRTYDDIIKLADKRLRAIEQNREVLIAGLKVVDIPGVESLGILQNQKGRSLNTSPSLGNSWML